MSAAPAGTGEAKRKYNPFTPTDDAAIHEHVRLHGTKDWEMVAAALGRGPKGKACRERYLHHLDPLAAALLARVRLARDQCIPVDPPDRRLTQSNDLKYQKYCSELILETTSTTQS
tara:strand:+ start:66 stop:413 length:348 start_codon:yes stop_codon:yes gene_type:complete